MKPFVHVQDRYYPRAKSLRTQFDRIYRDPRWTSDRRFIWDFWHVEDHYHHLRTPAQYVFEEKTFQDFYTHLVEWGRKNLGCHDISPPWLSLYPEGSFQNLHVDAPHGPLAWVYSLTVDPSHFRGGRTVLGKNKISGTKTEWSRSVTALKHKISIDPNFNRLIVFDPSYPHGVSPVQGVKDPQKMRLVMHGWFVQPRPFWYGPLKAEEIQKGLDHFFQSDENRLILEGMNAGYMGFRLKISSEGNVEQVKVLVQTAAHQKKQETDLIRKLKGIVFPKRSRGTELTFPILLS